VSNFTSRLLLPYRIYVIQVTLSALQYLDNHFVASLARPLLLHRIFFATFIHSSAHPSAIQPLGILRLVSIIYSFCASSSAQLRYLGRRIMSGAELKKRQLPKVNMSTTNDPTNQSKAKARTVTWQEISEWQHDNKYILRGYRPEKADYLEILTSLTFLHNETCNVYTHLVGALFLPLVATVFLRYLAEPQFLIVSSMDYAMFGFYFWCAETCLVLSTLFHVLQPHSHHVEQFWHGMDLLGIVIMTVGTFSSGIYYGFFCEPSLQKLHWAIVCLSGRPSPLYDMLI
jgi:hypothetical protein